MFNISDKMNGDVSHVAHEAFTGAGHDPGLQIWRIEVKPADSIYTNEFYFSLFKNEHKITRTRWT